MKSDNKRMGLFSFSFQDYFKVFVIASAYFFAHEIAFFFPDSQKVIMLVWPAGGVSLAAFLLNPRRLWPLLTLVFYISGITADLAMSGRPLMMSLGFMTGNMVESICCAWLIIYWSRGFQNFNKAREVLALIVSAVFVNAFSSCIGALTSMLTSGDSLLGSWQTWFIADGLGILLVGPFIVAWSRVKELKEILCFKKIIEGSAFLAVWIIFVWLIFHSNQFEFHLRPYMLVALLAWPAIRFGQRGVTFANMLVFVIAIFSPMIISGPAPWVWHGQSSDLAGRLMDLQIFLGFMSVVGYLLAAIYADFILASSQREEALDDLKKSRQLLESVVEGTQDAVFVKDFKGRYLLINSAACQATGKNASEILGQDDTFIFPADHARLLMERDRQVLDNKKIITFEYDLVNLNGNKRSVHSLKGPLFDKDGQVMGLFGISRDITERKQVHQQLVDTINYMQTFISTSPIAIITYKASGQAVSANTAAAKLVGTSIENLMKQNFRNLDSWKRDGFLDKAQKALDTGQEQLLECYTVSSFGAAFWISCRFVPFNYTAQPHLLFLATDISDKKQAEKYALEITAEKAAAKTAQKKAVEIAAAYQELQKARDLLTQSEKLSAIGVLVAGIAHELNSPLSGILGIVRFYLEHKNPDDREYRDLEQVLKAAERMSKIVQGLRDFSRPSVKEEEELNFNSMIESVLSFGQKIMIGPNIDLHKNFEKDLPMIKGDKNQVQQIIINLMSNATDAMQKKVR
ncbi:MAG: PAS domain S-box protein [Candidatus Omnitrophica bacterium]|nr:PAS domain S-box protein [Candidatus Omnitrophota bacterium]